MTEQYKSLESRIREVARQSMQKKFDEAKAASVRYTTKVMEEPKKIEQEIKEEVVEPVEVKEEVDEAILNSNSGDKFAKEEVEPTEKVHQILVANREFELLDEMETVSNKGDHDVLRAFANKQTHQSKKLSTDGKTLHGNWMGGQSIAQWDGDKVRLRAASSRSEQAVHRALTKKHLAPNDIHEGVEALNEWKIRTYKRASKLEKLHNASFAKYSRAGDRTKAEGHRRKAIELKRLAYAASDNPSKLPH